MNNLSFNKNSFIKNEPSRLSKPIINNPNQLGKRTIEEIKVDMHTLNKSKVEGNKQAFEDLQKNRQNNLNSLKTFKEWNKK